MIYTSFHMWRKAAEYRLKSLFSGVYGVVFCIVILGIVSLFHYLARQVAAFCRREAIAAGIIATLFVIILFGWLGTFVKVSYQKEEAQHRADSLAYKLSEFTQMYDTTETIVINGDTVRIGEVHN